MNTRAKLVLQVDKKPTDLQVSFAAWQQIEFSLLDTLPHVISSRAQADTVCWDVIARN